MRNLFLKDRTVLITGGTGSLGRALFAYLSDKGLKKLIILSDGEDNQVKMRRDFEDMTDVPVRYMLGNVRDYDRMSLAMHNVDYVIHCAAMKHIDVCEYNPIECTKTNVDGTKNVVMAAIANNVKKVLCISTDKAVAPTCIYGAAKLCADHLAIQSNVYGDTRISVARFGNYINSRGSVIPYFKKLKSEGKTLTVTHPEMTRFFISTEEVAERCTEALHIMEGGEIFSPKMASCKIDTLARAISPFVKYVGCRPGEKLHEEMISPDSSMTTKEIENFYVSFPKWAKPYGKDVAERWSYKSDDTNPDFRRDADWVLGG